MAKHTIGELYQMQSLSLHAKVQMTRTRIKGWVKEYGEDGVYVSFSGGKDSTVLLDIVRKDYPYIPAVFVDTGLEYPEIREFVKTFDNVVWLKPKMTFREVIEKYGYPFISKEVSECVYGARKYLTSILQEASLDRQTDRQYGYFYDKLCGQGKYAKSIGGGTTTSTVNYEELANILNQRMANKSGGNNRRLAIMLGMLTKDSKRPIKANIPSDDRSIYSQEKYKFLLDCPWDISNKCCNVIKKEPAHRYAKETGRKPMTAQMASESRLRTQKWLQNGCNGFNLKQPISNPMSFWTEQDVLLYIKENNLPICSVYGDIVEDRAGTDEVEGQMTISDMQGFEDMKLFDSKRLPLKTTGCNRTGCMFCGFGCHLEKEGDGRFERMKVTHPKIYDYVMRPKEQGGLK